LLVGAHREGGSELVRIGARPPTPPTPARGRRWWLLLAVFGVVVVGALAILARASFDSDDPAANRAQVARRAAAAGSPGDDRARGAVAESAHNPPAAAPGEPNRSGAVPVAELVAPSSAASAAPEGATQSVTTPPSGAAPTPTPTSTPTVAASTPAPAASGRAASTASRALRSQSSPSATTSSNSSKETSRGGAAGSSATNAAAKAGGGGTAGAGGVPGTKRPDTKLALAADLAKKDGSWQRPPFGEDANSRLVSHFTQAGGAILKGRVIDADNGKPSSGVTIEVHVGDAFMRTVTDPAGSFRMTNIFTNRRLTIWLIGRSDAFVAERLELTSSGEGETMDAGVVRLLRGDELASHLEGWMGMFVMRRGRRNVVAAVSPWSPADRAGIQVGDVLLSVEGRDVGGLGPRAASFLLRGPVGSRSTVALQNHDGTVVRYQLERVLR